MSETESVEKERDTSLTAFSTAITNSVISTSAAEKEKREKGVDEVEEESEDESDILEESPCGRWQKRREEVREDERKPLTSPVVAIRGSGAGPNGC